MADLTNREALDVLPVVPYHEVRGDLRSGDLFFASGDSLVSQAIRFCTKSPWSHVGIIFRVDTLDRVLLLESVEDMGVRLAPLSKYLRDYEEDKPYPGLAVVARVTGCTGETVLKLAAFGTDELTRPYDRDEIGRILARVTLGLPKARLDRAYICSELVYECFRSAGCEFAYNPRGFISPLDIWQDRRVEMVTRIL